VSGNLTDRSRRRIEAAIDRLTDRFGPVEPVVDDWTAAGEEYADLVDRVRAGTLGGAGAWVRDDRGRVLLVRRAATPEVWSEPSGHHEPGEDLHETARREVREETGVECRITGVALFQHVRYHPSDGRSGDHPPGSRSDDAGDPTDGGPIHRAIVVFDAEHVAGDPRPEPGEIVAAEWWDRHPEALLYEELRELPVPAAE